ncbi:M57 family metalloprotease [Aquimarina sp. 2201CG1-2-11]|uniref:M57 family metalloprotease n=1 Tax=Aquimarina discodermiae TaxID=3231043 RepID=UPI003463032E
MFNHRLKFLLVISIMTLISCEKESLNDEPFGLPDNAQETLDYLTEILGYDENDIQTDIDSEEFFVGDMGISFNYVQNRSLARTSSNGLEAKNQWIGQDVSHSHSRDITYFMEADFPQAYRSPFSWAAWHWSSVSANISIRSTNTRANADVILSTFNDNNTGAFARAGGPSGNGNVGNYLNINVAKNHNNTSDADKMALMLHELGHTLGFHHSDVTSGTHIPGTNNAAYHASNDCGSIMKSSVYTCGWTLSATARWTADDRTAITWAYGNNANNVASDNNNNNNNNNNNGSTDICNGVSAYAGGRSYSNGDQVTHGGYLYTLTNNRWVRGGQCGSASSNSGNNNNNNNNNNTNTNSDICSGVSAYNSGQSYSNGSKITYNGYLYTLTNGRWVNGGRCGG